VLESDGVPIGTVCVLDTKPRAGGISDKQRRGLEALAVQAMAALDRSATAGRDRYRLALTERLRDAVDTQAMMGIATEALGRYLGVAQVGFAEVEDDQAHVRVHRDWNDGRIASVVGRWHIDDFGPDFIRDVKAGQTIVIPDVELDARTNSAEVLKNFADIGTRALLNIGLIRNGKMRALLFTHHHQPRSWTPDDIEIVHETVERLWASVERARADERLIQSEAIARARADQIGAIFSAAPVGLAVLDRDLRYINVNERLAEMNGVPSADHIGRTLREVVPDLDAQAVKALEQVLAGQELLGIEFVGMTAAQPGVVRTWRSNWVPMRNASGEISGATLSGEEITDEKAIQQALTESETRLTQAQTLGGIGSWEWDHDTGEGIVSDSYRVLHRLGGKSDRLTSADLLDIMHPDDRAAFGEAVRSGLATGERITVEYRITHTSGEVRTIRGTGQRIGASDSARTAGIVEDVTERRATQQRLALLADTASRLLVANDPARMVDELFALIAGALNLDIFMKCRLDEDGALTLVAQTGLVGDATSAVRSLHGASLDRRVARERVSIMAVDIQASDDSAHDFIRAQGVDHYACYPLVVGDRLHGTLGYGRRSGQSFEEDERAFLQTVSHYVAIALERVSDEAELQALNADLETQVKVRTSELQGTNRKLQSEIKRREASQAALIQGQKLEALGQLTAGIAHDFNNILAAIAGGMDLIERRVDDQKVKYITGHCKDAAFRGASLVKQMLAFARQEVLAPRSAKLARLADEIAPLIRQAIPGNIVSIDFPADLPPVLIDPVLLETALLNLAVNARDAMPGGGTLSLTARNRSARHRAVLHHQGTGQGHRARAGDGLWLHRSVRRRDANRQPRRRGHNDNAISAACHGGGRSGGRGDCRC
jgi:PAS domain S-box-containing protein